MYTYYTSVLVVLALEIIIFWSLEMTIIIYM
jgi:hypothetical protein